MTTEETRAQVARGWEQSGLTQAEYARQHGISERTLRSLRRRYCPSGMPVEAAREAISVAIGKLQAILVDLDAEAACRSAGEEPRRAASQPEMSPARVEPLVPGAAEAAQVSDRPNGREVGVSTAPGSYPTPGKKSFFDWEAEDEPEPVVEAQVPAPTAADPVPEAPTEGPLGMPGLGVPALQ
jgi:transposase-like protein